MEVVFIQLFSYNVSKQSNKNENTEYYDMFIIQKSPPLKTRDSHYCLVWIMEFSIILSRLSKKFFR